MAILIRAHVSKSRRAGQVARWLLVSAALVVTAPAVAWASPDQEAQTITRLAAEVNSAEPRCGAPR